MSLESATHIHELVPTNPASGDPKYQGDDHLRMIKATLKNTFPNITGPVEASHEEINFLAGVERPIVEQLAEKLDADEVGNAEDKVPLNNGSLNVSLNADMWDGANLIIRTSPPTNDIGKNGDICFVREA